MLLTLGTPQKGSKETDRVHRKKKTNNILRGEKSRAGVAQLGFQRGWGWGK